MKFIKTFVLLFVSAIVLRAQNALERQLQCADAGSTDTYACNIGTAPAAYVTGQHYRFKANTANTGAASINFNSLGAKTIKKLAGGTSDLADNDIRVGQWVDLVYDGTNMQIQSTLGNAASGGGGTPYVMTSGFGYWFPPEVEPSNVHNGSAFSDQKPFVYQFSVRGVPITFDTIAFEIDTPSGTCSGTCHARMGIFAADGTTKLCDSGSLESGGSGLTNINAMANTVVAAPCALTLDPGFYWLQFCTDSTTFTVFTPNWGPLTPSSFVWKAYSSPPGSLKAGKSSNTCGGGGASPVTLTTNGTITPDLDVFKGPMFWVYTN